MWAWPWARVAPQNLWFPFNISATDKGSNFKICRQISFAKAHHKIRPRRNSGRGHGLGEFHKILGFPFNISATAETSDFKFGTQLGFATANHKITPRGKVGAALG